jgi:hypothetical protein
MRCIPRVIAFNLACYASVTGHMEEAKVRLPSILIKNIRRLAVGGDDPTDQEASKCSNTVKYHDVRRSLQNEIPLSKSQHGIVARRLPLGAGRHGWRCLRRVGGPH